VELTTKILVPIAATTHTLVTGGISPINCSIGCAISSMQRIGCREGGSGLTKVEVKDVEVRLRKVVGKSCRILVHLACITS